MHIYIYMQCHNECLQLSPHFMIKKPEIICKMDIPLVTGCVKISALYACDILTIIKMMIANSKSHIFV